MSVTPQTTAPLTDRIASALRKDTASDAIAALIAESEQARTAAEAARGNAHARALDPTAGTKMASAAKLEADDLQFEVDRLDSALVSLGTAHQDAKAREADARRRAAYDLARAERDALVEELRQVYPEIERRLSDLIGRVAANDSVLERINHNLPSGGRRLTRVEEVARGGREKFDWYGDYLRHRITSRLRLPRFDVDPRDPDAWPRSSR